MAVPAAVLSILVQANTGGATRGLLRFNQQLGGTETQSQKATRALGTFAKVGVIGAGVGLGFAVKKAADFEEQMDSLGSVTKASGKEMELFRKQAMKAGADTKFSALDAAEAQTELAKGGLRVRQIMRGGLKSALALAAAGEMELAEAASTTANALNLFGLRGKDSMKVADALAMAARATTADVSDFAMALRQSGGVAKTAGLSFSETVLALEALAASGTKNSDAGTSLKTALIQLIKPTEKQLGLANKLNLEFLDAEGNFKNLADVSSMLRDRLGGMTAAQRTATLATLAGTDGVRTLTALYDAGPSKLEKWKKGLNESGTAAEVAARKQSNLKGKLENLQGSIETAAIGIGTKLLPTLTKAATALTKLINDPKLTGGEKFARFMEMVTQAVEKAVPVVAAAGVKIAGALASGLARGWREMNPLMKLFTAAAVIRLVGGRGALLASGGAIGRLLGVGIASGAATAAAGGAAGGAAAGGLLGSMRGKLLPLAKRAGLAGVGIALADSVISEFGRRSAAKSPDIQTALAAAMKPTKALGLSRENFIGMKVIQDLGGEGKRIEQAMKLKKALESVTNAQKGIGHQKAKELREEIEKLPGASARAKSAMNRIVADYERVGERSKWLQDRFQSMRTKGARSFNELAQRVQFNTKLIRETMGTNSKRGQQAMTENFIAAARNVRQQMREAGKVTKRGTELIEFYMVKALQNMGFNKADAIALRGRGKGSTQTPGPGGRGELIPHQRGGPIMEGALSGDSVPSILERGEYVLNRKAVRKVGRKALDTINFGEAPRFAKGGSVGIQNMVAAANQFERAGFPYLWGGGHQATPAPFGPVDCSGAVSYVLQHGGVKIPTMVSGAMTGIGKPGKGAVTVYANPGHVLMSLMGRFFGTSTSNPGGGAGWIDPAPDAGYLSGFTARHFGKNDVGAGFPGMGGAPKLPKVLVDGPDSLLKANAQAAISTTHAAAQEKLNNIAAQAAAPIGTGDAGTHTGSWAGGSTRAFAQRLASRVGLSLGSGYRTPAYNASVGGAPNSMHTHGTVANPGAWDVPVLANGPDSAKGDKLAALGRAARLAEVIWKAPDHYDHVHLGFFQKGGLVEKLMGMQKGGAAGARTGKLRANQTAWMEGIWSKVAPHFGADPASELPFSNLRFNKDLMFPGFSLDPGAKDKATGELWWPKWLVHGKDKIPKKSRTQLFLHELAHRFQADSETTSGMLAEGGAEGWARWAMPNVLGKPTQPSFGYGKDVRKVLKRKGLDWVLHGQFGQPAGSVAALQAGGLMGMQAGGAPGSRMDEYKRLLVLANRKIGVPPPPVGAGLVDVESKWDPAAVSGAGAFGLTQFMPGTAPSYGVQRGTSHGAVSSQILGMAKYLKELGFRGDPRGALAKYNGGPGNPQYGYAADVMAASKKYPPSTFADLVGGGGSGDGGGGGGKGTSGEGGPIKKLAYVGDSLGVGTLGAGLKAKLGKIKLASSVSKGKTSSWGVGALKGLLGKDVGAAMLDMGTNDGTAGNLRPSIDAVEGMLGGRPLLMASLDPQSTDVAKKNAAIRSNANVVVPWAGIAQKFAANKVHPTGAGYSKRASLIASAAKRLRTGSKGDSGLTDREKKQLKTPLKGSVGKVLTQTLKVLRSNRPAKFRGTRLKQLEKRIKAMDVGLPDGIRKQIATLRAGIEETGEYADRASSLSVDNDDGTTSLGVIKGKTEAGWVTDQLDMLFRLRERLVDAKKIVEKHRAEVQKLIERMQKRLQALAEDIRTAAKAKREAEQHLHQLQKHPRQNREAIRRQKAVIDRIEGNQAGRVRERDAISDKILPALTGKRKQFTAFINENIMGSDGLPQIQGLGSPLEKLKVLPPVGVLGGDIFDAQMRLRELAAPATSITDDATPETSESAELLKQLLQEANLRTAVSQKQYEVLRNMPPYGGQFATGGVVPGPIGAARTIVAHGGETVTPPGNGASNVQINLGPGMEWLDKYIEVKVDGVTRKQARAGARGLPGRGGGF